MRLDESLILRFVPQMPLAAVNHLAQLYSGYIF